MAVVLKYQQHTNNMTGVCMYCNCGGPVGSWPPLKIEGNSFSTNNSQQQFGDRMSAERNVSP